MKRWYLLPTILVAAILSVLIVLWLVPEPHARIQLSLALVAAWTLMYVGVWIFLSFVVVERDAHTVEEFQTMRVHYTSPKLLSERSETIEAPYEIIREEETK